MLEHEQGAGRVGAKGQQGVGGRLREQHAWEDEDEVEAVGRCREDIRARSGRIGGGFI